MLFVSQGSRALRGISRTTPMVFRLRRSQAREQFVDTLRQLSILNTLTSCRLVRKILASKPSEYYHPNRMRGYLLGDTLNCTYQVYNDKRITAGDE